MPFVVDDHGDARVAFAVAGLVHADRREAAERRRHRRFQPFSDPMGGVFRRRATRRAENRLRSSGSRRSSATRVPIRNRVWTGCPARPTARKRPRRRTPPPWSCPRHLLPHREHRSIPARGRTRISSTGTGRRDESTMRASSTTTFLTLRSCLNILFIGRFLDTCFSWSMNILPRKRSSLTPATAQQQTTTHENSNSAKILRCWDEAHPNTVPHLS